MTKKARIKRKLKRILPLEDIDCYNHPSGCSGRYIKLSDKIGIKVDRSQYPNIRDLRREVKMMKLARMCYKLVPRCYGLIVFKDLNGNERMGILMQHVGDMTLMKMDSKDRFSIHKKISKSLRKGKICHDDLHERNIMYYKGKFRPIDFGCAFVVK